MLLFSVSSPFYQCLALNVGTESHALHVQDVGGLGICIMGGSVLLFFVPEIKGNEPQYSVGRVAAFLCLFLPPEVFGDDDSKFPLLIWCQQLLIGHVIVSFAWHVVVSDVHHRTFIYIETHLPLVLPLNKFIDIFL